MYHPILSAMNCTEDSELIVKADYDSITAKCAKCKHVATAAKACFMIPSHQQPVDSRETKKQHTLAC